MSMLLYLFSPMVVDKRHAGAVTWGYEVGVAG
jgi:hypothetical protein